MFKMLGVLKFKTAGKKINLLTALIFLSMSELNPINIEKTFFKN